MTWQRSQILNLGNPHSRHSRMRTSRGIALLTYLPCLVPGSALPQWGIRCTTSPQTMLGIDEVQDDDQRLASDIVDVHTG